MRSENEIDAWALKREFFSKFFEVARKELFENIDDMPWYDVVKFSKGNLQIFKIFGIIILHILLKQAAYFSFLAPWVLETSGCETLSGISASIYCMKLILSTEIEKTTTGFIIKLGQDWCMYRLEIDYYFENVADGELPILRRLSCKSFDGVSIW